MELQNTEVSQINIIISDIRTIEAYEIEFELNSSVVTELPSCSDDKPCKDNEVCKDFNGLSMCDCKGGFYFKDKTCVGKGVVSIIVYYFTERKLLWLDSLYPFEQLTFYQLTVVTQYCLYNCPSIASEKMHATVFSFSLIVIYILQETRFFTK